MTRLATLVLAALVALSAISAAQADTKTCTCTCQCATPTGKGSVRAIPKPDPPKVLEAINGELDVSALNGADATVQLTYPEIADGHTVGMRWTGIPPAFDVAHQTVGDGAKTVTFKIPNSVVQKDLGQSVVLTGSVGVGDESLVISQPLTIKVVDAIPPGQYPKPTLPGSPDNQVDVGALTGDLIVRVHYPSMAQGQIVKVLWRGATSYDTPMRVTPDSEPLEFTITKATVIASLGKPVALSYEVALDGQPGELSDPARLNITLATLPDPPVVPAAVQGQVNLRDLLGKDLKVTFTYPGISAGHTVGIRWTGTPPFDTPHPVIGDTPRPLEFTIPYEKVRLERDKTVTLTASVGLGDGKLVMSPELSLKIIDTRPKGEEVAADLNARYNDTAATCGDLPSYYCNGVTTRGTTNSNFDPWDPSITQQRKGSISFSHIRKDAKITYLWRDSGYILFSQNEAVNQKKIHEYLCAFPHDGATDLSRGAYGCGFQVTRGTPGKSANQLMQIAIRNPELPTLFKQNEQVVDRLANGKDASDLLQADPKFAALVRKEPELGRLLQESLAEVEASNKTGVQEDSSTCAQKNAQTLNGWFDFTKALTNRVYQCSLSTQDPSQFAVSLNARQYDVPTEVYSTWNEVLIKVWAAGIPEQLPLQAFYYQNATGLPEAKEYQRKYVARTAGQWLPVIKLDPTKFNGNPFSYNEADQAVQQ